MYRNRFVWLSVLFSIVWGGVSSGAESADTQASILKPPSVKRRAQMEALGKQIFFDENLSANKNQSCASCHSSGTGWTGPDQILNLFGGVYEGSAAGLFGSAKPPSIAYAGDAPILHQQSDLTWVGGMFYNGRATGDRLNDPIAEQAQFPFINPVEQALAHPAAVVERVCSASYADMFREVWGQHACDDVDKAYDYIARAIAAFERSEEVNPFTSKYDYFLAGKVALTAKEAKGLKLFNGKGGCARCHPSTIGPHNPKHPLFTTFKYDNLGMPKNPRNPFYNNSKFNPKGADWVDLGLGGHVNSNSQHGKQKIPTLRNVDKRPFSVFVKAYGHNGYFKSLESIVHFYNTRDVLCECAEPLAQGDRPGENCWPPAEVPENVDRNPAWWPGETGNLDLSAEEEACIVAFMKTLSDGWGWDAGWGWIDGVSGATPNSRRRLLNDRVR